MTSKNVKIIDNDRRQLMDVINSLSPDYEELSIATGYWDLLGTMLVFDNIKHYKKIRLLIGRELLIPRHQVSEPEPDFPDKDFFFDLERLQPSAELKALVGSLKELINKGILEVKIYKKTFLHAKCYIFGNYESENAVGIIGSSNFTKNGLTQNLELNALESDPRTVLYKPTTKTQEVGHLFWFDQLWEEPTSILWNGQFKKLLEMSPTGDVLYSPYETYIRTLYELYKEELEDEKEFSNSGKFELMDFQKKNVQALLRRLNKYRVAMLADSVGLGKTITAIEVIKHYLNTDEGKKRVEIICPKSLKQQWKKELATQDVLHLIPITLQNEKAIQSEMGLDNIASVSLFVIDESHNLRNRAGKRFQLILEWLENNPNAHVLLLTATPINNQLNDIVNQILLGTRGEANVLMISAIDKQKQTEQITFAQVTENLQKKIKQDMARDGEIDYEYIRQVMSPIIRAFVVRRTRQGIQKEYGNLYINGQKQSFPQVEPDVKEYGFKPAITEKVLNIKPKKYINTALIYGLTTDEIVSNTTALLHPLDQIKAVSGTEEKISLEKLSPIYFIYKIVLLLGFIPYRWQMYKTKYYGKTRKQIKDMNLSGTESKTLFLQLSIYGILRTMFLKRLESSVSAIRTSLTTYKRKLDIFAKGLKQGKIISLKDFAYIEEQFAEDEELEEDDTTLPKDVILDEVNSKKYALDELNDDIKKELALIDLLDQQLAFMEQDDSKIKAFAGLIDELAKTKPAGSKVLVFSFYADTIEYLKDALPKYSKNITADNSGFLSSKNRSDAEDLANRFAPIAKKYSINAGEQELNYLISTDVLSEGQNLQDCGVLINYDLHWNPVRMIQRNGRVNRLGTKFSKVYIYNISPEDQLEEYLHLINRLEGKIQLIRNTIGTDTPVLDEEENPIDFTDSWKDIYSKSMQKRIEALQKAENETDLLLSEDEYIADLKYFHSKFPSEYRDEIYHMYQVKWGVMPHSDLRGKMQRPEIMALSRILNDKNQIVGTTFHAMNKDGNMFQAMPQLQSLELLKTTYADNQRTKDRISVDKSMLAKITQEKSSDYVPSEDIGTPLPQQVSLLRIMVDNQFDQNDIECVRLGFQTSNVLDNQKIKQLTKKIIKAKNANEAYLDLLNELIETAKKTSQKRTTETPDTSTTPVLFFARDNE